MSNGASFMRHIVSILAFALATANLNAADLRLLPEKITLHGSEGRQQLYLVTVRDERVSASVSADEFELKSSDPAVVEIRDGVARALSNGDAVITARMSDGREATTAYAPQRASLYSISWS